MPWVYAGLGLIFGFSVSFILLYPKIHARIQADTRVKETNIRLQLENEQMQENISSVVNDLNVLKQQYEDEKAAQLHLLQNDYSEEKAKLEKNYKLAENEAKIEYLSMLEELADEYQLKQQDFLKYNDLVVKFQGYAQAAQQEYKIALEEEKQANFYKLELSDIDIQEIKKIRELGPYLRDNLPLNKVIWSVYYQPQFNALRGRVLNNEAITGIYKLTNTITNEVYIGQAVNIANRWSQHIKAGIGASTVSSNKLYKSMEKYGPEAFTYRVISKCDAEKLNEEEAFWINYYNSKSLGLNEIN